jgi:hypothetical protein
LLSISSGIRISIGNYRAWSSNYGELKPKNFPVVIT